MPTTSSTTSKATPSSQRGRCADLRRVAIEITASRVTPPRQRRAECRACGADTAVPVDPEPPVLCAACHLDAGDVVLDRETGHRLVVLQVTPGRADEVAVAGGDTTVAAHPTNEGYPPADPVVEVVYATSVIRNDDPTRDSFPLSRLAPTDDAAIVDADPLPDWSAVRSVVVRIGRSVSIGHPFPSRPSSSAGPVPGTPTTGGH